MADKTFNLEIVTPRKIAYSGSVLSFSAPGVVGGFQVLYNHAPLLSNIAIGEVKIVDAQEKESHYATSGGFVEVHDNKVIMLAETVERTDEIDTSRAQEARERAQRRISEKKVETDMDRAKVALQRAINRLKVAGRN
jgi:F-type H+-transporting ATPase subunit epsilon